jgi:hypothetical protein
MRESADDPNDRTAWFVVGPMWPWHVATVSVWPFAFNLALPVAGAASHLVDRAEDRRAAERAWLQAYLDTMNAVNRGTGLALDGLGEPPDSLDREVYAPGRAAVLARLAEIDEPPGG